MNFLKNKTTISFLVLAIVVLIPACKSKKRAVDTDSYTKNWNEKNAIDDVLNNTFDFKSISTKGNLELKIGESGKRVGANYKIIKDSIMQVSVRVPILGEAFRVDFTPDRVVIIDRLKGLYASERFADSKALKSIDLNYYNLQALLTNSLFIPGEKEVKKKDYSKFKINAGNDMLMLQTAGKPDLMYSFAVDASEKIISLLVTKKSLDNTLQFTYSDFVKHDNAQFYPTLLVGSINMGKRALTLAISYSEFDVDNKNMTIDTSIPKKYKEVTFSELLEQYTKLKF